MEPADLLVTTWSRGLRLKAEGYYVAGVDLKHPEFESTAADKFLIGDLRNPEVCASGLSDQIDEVYQLAADMGGAGYLFTGESDAEIMHNSVLININTLNYCRELGVPKLFYSSSACVYPEKNQLDPNAPNCREDTVYPADPDSEYGWEKLFSERLYQSYERNFGLQTNIARFHNIFGHFGTWRGGKEKVPAALCRKVAECPDGGEIEIWGDGEQTRSFLFVEDAIEAIRRLVEHSDFNDPVNIGSDRLISINSLAQMIIDLSGKSISLKHVDGPLGVRGRNSHNTLIREKLEWEPTHSLEQGISKTYEWISEQVAQSATLAQA